MEACLGPNNEKNGVCLNLCNDHRISYDCVPQKFSPVVMPNLSVSYVSIASKPPYNGYLGRMDMRRHIEREGVLQENCFPFLEK